MNRNLTIKRHYFLLALIGALVLAAALVLSGKPVNIGTDRRFVWDSRIIDSSVTTASRVFHSPAKQGRVLYADSPEDLEKLEAVRRQMRDNLADPVFRGRAAKARFARACSRLPHANDDLKTARLKAGGLLMDVAEVFAFGQGEYYHYGLK